MWNRLQFLFFPVSLFLCALAMQTFKKDFLYRCITWSCILWLLNYLNQLESPSLLQDYKGILLFFWWFYVFICAFKPWTNWLLSWYTMWNAALASVFFQLVKHHLWKFIFSSLTCIYHIPNSHIYLNLFLCFILFHWPVCLYSIIFGSHKYCLMYIA